MNEDLDLRAGMFVLSIDGQKLGRIAKIDGEGFDVVRGSRSPVGFHVPFGELASKLKGEVFLLQRFRDYEPLYTPRAEPAPRAQPRTGGAGRRFLLLRRNEARW